MKILATRSLAFLFLAFSFLAAPLRASAGDEWIWVVGHLDNEEQQQEYEDFARGTFDYYQGLGIYTGRLVREEDLDEQPTAQVVFLGPLQAFEHKDWLKPLIEFEGDSLRVGDRILSEPRVGIFVRDRGAQRVLYVGTSAQGWRDIFTVPTGGTASTITVDGTVRFEGDYDDAGLKLGIPPFLQPFPDLTQLERLADAADAIRCEPVFTSERPVSLTPAFEERLEELVSGQRVLFVGESHWNTGVNQLFNRILAKLLERGGVRAVVFEINYSFSAHYDHYVTLEDEAASRFLREELHPLVPYGSRLEALDLVRHHNLTHPDDPVRIACYDMEWRSDATLRRVVLPYMRSLDQNFELDAKARIGGRGHAAEGLRIRRMLEGTMAKQETHAFLSRAFVLNTLTNLADTYALGGDEEYGGFETIKVDRQLAMVRNVTQFHGALLDGPGLTIFNVGSFHARKLAQDDGWWREAAYLHQIHEPTRGRVATLLLDGLGCGFDEVGQLDPQTRMLSATRYHNFIDGFRKGLASGTAEPGQFYLLGDGPMHPVHELVALIGLRQQWNVLWLKSVDEAALLDAFGERAGGHARTAFDEVVFVLRSQLESTRPLEFRR